WMVPGLCAAILPVLLPRLHYFSHYRGVGLLFGCALCTQHNHCPRLPANLRQRPVYSTQSLYDHFVVLDVDTQTFVFLLSTAGCGKNSPKSLGNGALYPDKGAAP